MDDAVARAVSAGLGSELRVVSAHSESMPSGDGSVAVAPGVFLDESKVERMERLALERLARSHGMSTDAIDLRSGSPPEVIESVAALRGADASSCDVLLVPEPESAETPRSH